MHLRLVLDLKCFLIAKTTAVVFLTLKKSQFLVPQAVALVINEFARSIKVPVSISEKAYNFICVGLYVAPANGFVQEVIHYDVPKERDRIPTC